MKTTLPLTERQPTGDWKTKRPLRDSSQCIHCLWCYNFCPDDCWQVKEGKIVDKYFDEFCKGCGICAAGCPKKCIEMNDL